MRHSFNLHSGLATRQRLPCLKCCQLFGIDAGDLSALVLSDLCAAFDTVDHNFLLQRLERPYGLACSVRQWFQFHLVGRRQFIRTGSSLARILCGDHRGRSLDRSSSCCTLLTCYCLLKANVSALICMQMTPNLLVLPSVCNAVASEQHLYLHH